MINKKNNVNLQLTISKKDFERLEEIKKELKGLLTIDFTKSQTISFLIRNYGKSTLKSVDINKGATNQSDFNYQIAVKTLKEKLKKTYSELSKITQVSESTLKKYALGLQNPNGNNKILLDETLKKYGLK